MICAQTQRSIRAWAQGARHVGEYIPELWVSDGSRLIYRKRIYAQKTSYAGVILLQPSNRRRHIRHLRDLYRTLRPTRIPLVVGDYDQFQSAGLDKFGDTVQVIAQETGRLGLPMTLLAVYKFDEECYFDEELARYRHKYRARREYYLTGYDDEEGPRGYFLCQLPPRDSENPWTRIGGTDGHEREQFLEIPHDYTNLEDAFKALQPAAVEEATSFNRSIKRQGDLFMVEVPTFDPNEDPMYLSYGPLLDTPLLNTNHFGAEVLVVGDETYVRGTVYHAPSGRSPDHKPLRLGKTWHLVQKNRVPIESGSTR